MMSLIFMIYRNIVRELTEGNKTQRSGLLSRAYPSGQRGLGREGQRSWWK